MSRRTLLHAPLAVVLIAVLPTVTATPSADADPGLAGVYYSERRAATGDADLGLVVIQAEDGEEFRVDWLVPGQPPQTGHGVRRGDMFVVTFAGPLAGVALYEIEDRLLTGTWTTYGAAGAVSFETLVRVPEEHWRRPATAADAASAFSRT